MTGTQREAAAAIDAGSNSVHLLVAGTPALEPLLDVSDLLGLGDVVDRDGRLGDDARERLVLSVLRQRDLAFRHGAARVTLLGTEPFRRAQDRPEVLHDLEAATGLRMQVLSHEQEGMLTLLGVTAGRGVVGRLLVVDIGGGSSEFVIATGHGIEREGVVATGSARLTAAFLRHDPPLPDELQQVRAEAERLLEVVAGPPLDEGIFVGGTASNVLKVAVATGHTDPSAPRAVTAEDIVDLYGVLLSMPAADLSAGFGVNLRRARTLTAGAALLEAFLHRTGLAAARISDASLREGAILAASIAGDEWVGALPALVAQSARGFDTNGNHGDTQATRVERA